MKTPRFTDGRKGRYRTATESREPGYLARRFRLYKRVQRMKARSATVTTLRKAANER